MVNVLKWVIDALKEEKIECHRCKTIFSEKSLDAGGEDVEEEAPEEEEK